MENATSDQMIGRNVQAMRGSRSQQDVADRMREAGWKWSQATVWAVEKGERPLRLAEAVELTLIFRVPLLDLLRLPDELLFHDRVALFREAQSALASAAYQYEDEARELGKFADNLIAQGQEKLVQETLGDIDLSISARDLLAYLNTDAVSVRAAALQEVSRMEATDPAGKERRDQSVDHG